MATMNVSLPDELKSYVEERAASGEYAGTSDFVRDLVRRDRRRQEAVAEFEAIVAKADASGTCEGTLEEIRAEIKEEARRRAGETERGSAA